MKRDLYRHQSACLQIHLSPSDFGHLPVPGIGIKFTPMIPKGTVCNNEKCLRTKPIVIAEETLRCTGSSFLVHTCA